MNTPRPVSIPHLVLGLVFTGIAAVWAIGQATDADLPQTAVGLPVVLIAAGVAGLVASVISSRRRDRLGDPETLDDAAPASTAESTAASTAEDTAVLADTPEDPR